VPVEGLEAAYLSYAPNDGIVLAPGELCLLKPGEEVQTGSNSLAFVDDVGRSVLDESGNQIVFFQSIGDLSRFVPGHGWWQAGTPVFGLLPSNRRPLRTMDVTYPYDERVVEIRVDDPEPRLRIPGYSLERGAHVQRPGVVPRRQRLLRHGPRAGVGERRAPPLEPRGLLPARQHGGRGHVHRRQDERVRYANVLGVSPVAFDALRQGAGDMTIRFTNRASALLVSPLPTGGHDAVVEAGKGDLFPT
jgi:hypothetical protein